VRHVSEKRRCCKLLRLIEIKRFPECGTLFKKLKFLVPESTELGRTVEWRRPTKQLLAATCCVIWICSRSSAGQRATTIMDEFVWACSGCCCCCTATTLPWRRIAFTQSTVAIRASPYSADARSQSQNGSECEAPEAMRNMQSSSRLFW